MIEKISESIKTTLSGLGVFKKVEMTIGASVLSAPPSAAFFLALDRHVTDSPMVTRELSWDLVLMVPAAGPSKGQAGAGSIIDRVRGTFSCWLPFTTGGVLPSKVVDIRLEGIEATLLVYIARVTMQVMPDMIH